MPTEKPRAPGAGETVFGSAAARAVAAERQRIGVDQEESHDDWAETWGRRIGRALAIGALVCLIAWLALAWAGAQTMTPWSSLTPRDQKRVGAIEESRRIGLKEATGGDEAEFEKVSALLEAPAQPITDPARLTGKWRCRTIKLGGGLPLTAYGFFDCTITESEGGLFLQKPTGSQRKRGLLMQMDGKRMLYRGTSYYSYNEPKPYGEDPETDEAGILAVVSADRLRLELPQPVLESKHDVIELVR